MSSASAVVKAVTANKEAIVEAIHRCAAAGQVVAHLIKRPKEVSNQIVHEVVRVIALKVLARDVARISADGSKLIEKIMVKQNEITAIHDTLRKVANDNKPMAKEIEDALPQLKTRHHELEELLNELYEPNVAADFGLVGEKAPDLGNVNDRKTIRVGAADSSLKPGTNITRLEGKNIRRVSNFAEVAELVKAFELNGSGGGKLKTAHGEFPVRQVHVFESAEGNIFLFDLDDGSPGRGIRRAVETQQGAERKLYVEFEMLKVPYKDKPTFAHIVHAHHPVSDVPMEAFTVFGHNQTVGYSYEHWWTILLTNSRLGTPHQTITALQSGRAAAMRDWATNAKRLFEAAIAFKKEFGKPNGPRLSDFKGDLRAHSFKTLLEDAGNDLRRAGVPEPQIKECLDNFRQQANDRIASLLKEQLVPEHYNAITEGLRP